jgi:uncharacterized repeat protein (TIGR01451 family)
VVANPGDTPLSNLTITDTAPAETKIVAAPQATVSGNQAVWNLAELPAGQKLTLNLTLTSTTPGTHCNAVIVTTAEGLSGTNTACTLWKGSAGLLLEMIDTVDPIQVGEETDYVVTITNQGTAEDSNIKVTMTFPKEVKPLTATGDSTGAITDQTVTFEPYPKLAPKQAAKWTIRGKGMAEGDARTRVHYTSDLIKTPVAKEESTHVY